MTAGWRRSKQAERELMTPTREPDLDNIVTAVAVMADERIFDDNYMSFDMWRLKALLNNAYSSCEKEYEKYIGGHGNVILKEFLNGKKLAK